MPKRLAIIGGGPKGAAIAAKAEAFYVERLGFLCTDRFLGVGPFLRPRGSLDHHCLFLIQTPAFMKGCEHFTFHLGGPTELMQAGTRFVDRGYQSFEETLSSLGATIQRESVQRTLLA